MTKISLTPIIDVVFILLIFFMLASNFNKVGELDMNMSRESTQSSDDDIKIIKLLVRQDQSVVSEGKVYEDKDLPTMLRLAIKDSNKYSIILTAKNDVTYQRYLSLMSMLKENKMDNVYIGMSTMKIKSKTKRNYEDDGMLPLVNIIFLLLIFFMIVGVIEKNVVKENIQLPAAALAKFDNRELTKIFIDKEKSIFINDEKIYMNQVNQKLKLIKNKEVVLIADKSLLIKDINLILVELQKNKIENIKLLSSINAN